MLAILFGLSVGLNVLLALGARKLYRLNQELLAPPEAKPSESDAGEALLEVIEASLLDEPSAWESGDGVLTHSGGTQVRSDDGVVTITHQDSSFGVTPSWEERLIRACKSRNTRTILNSFREQK